MPPVALLMSHEMSMVTWLALLTIDRIVVYAVVLAHPARPRCVVERALRRVAARLAADVLAQEGFLGAAERDKLCEQRAIVMSTLEVE